MPHILIQAFEENCNVKKIDIHVEVHFSQEYHKTPKAEVKLEEIQEKIEKVVAEYFEGFSSESYTNHEWNLKMNEH